MISSIVISKLFTKPHSKYWVSPVDIQSTVAFVSGYDSNFQGLPNNTFIRRCQCFFCFCIKCQSHTFALMAVVGKPITNPKKRKKSLLHGIDFVYPAPSSSISCLPIDPVFRCTFGNISQSVEDNWFTGVHVGIPFLSNS